MVLASSIYAALWVVLIVGRLMMHQDNKKAASPEPQKVQDWRRILRGMKF